MIDRRRVIYISLKKMSAKRKYDGEISTPGASANKAPRVDEKSNFTVKIHTIFGNEYVISLPDEPRVLDLYMGLFNRLRGSMIRTVLKLNGKALPRVCSVLLSECGVVDGSKLLLCTSSIQPEDDPFRIHLNHLKVVGRRRDGKLASFGPDWDLSYIPGHPVYCDCVVKTNRNVKHDSGFDLMLTRDRRNPTLDSASFFDDTVSVILTDGTVVPLHFTYGVANSLSFEMQGKPEWKLGEIHQIHFNYNSASVDGKSVMCFLDRTVYKQSLVLQFLPMSYTEQECLVELRQAVFLNQKIDPLLWLMISYLFFPTL